MVYKTTKFFISAIFQYLRLYHPINRYLIFVQNLLRTFYKPTWQQFSVCHFIEYTDYNITWSTRPLQHLSITCPPWNAIKIYFWSYAAIIDTKRNLQTIENRVSNMGMWCLRTAFERLYMIFFIKLQQPMAVLSVFYPCTTHMNNNYMKYLHHIQRHMTRIYVPYKGCSRWRRLDTGDPYNDILQGMITLSIAFIAYISHPSNCSEPNKTRPLCDVTRSRKI